jgi:hypothetical protein
MTLIITQAVLVWDLVAGCGGEVRVGERTQRREVGDHGDLVVIDDLPLLEDE